VCDIVKAYADTVGLDDAPYGTHSPRSGFHDGLERLITIA
jgi:hypothetical protein